MDFQAKLQSVRLPEQSQTLSAQVMKFVRDSVQAGEMDTETWYSVYQLAEKLQVSRSPVREGLLRLEEAGLIEFVRNRGFRIIETQPEEVSEIFSLRLAIEPTATARAARLRSEENLAVMHELLLRMDAAAKDKDEAAFFHWDELLHEEILAAGHSKRGAKILAQLRAHTRILSDSTVRQYRTLEQVQSEHEPIVNAIEQKEPGRASAAMATHITATGRLLLRQAIAVSHGEKQDTVTLEAEVDRIWDLFV